MKKRKWLLLLILCIGLCGCGKENGSQDDFTAVGGEMEEAMDGNMLTLSMRIPETLNPLLNREEAVDRVLKLMYLPLLANALYVDKPSKTPCCPSKIQRR